MVISTSLDSLAFNYLYIKKISGMVPLCNFFLIIAYEIVTATERIQHEFNDHFIHANHLVLILDVYPRKHINGLSSTNKYNNGFTKIIYYINF